MPVEWESLGIDPEQRDTRLQKVARWLASPSPDGAAEVVDDLMPLAADELVLDSCRKAVVHRMEVDPSRERAENEAIASAPFVRGELDRLMSRDNDVIRAVLTGVMTWWRKKQKTVQ